MWEGYARAVHEYLAQQDPLDRIRQTPGGVAYVLKGNEIWVPPPA